MSSTDKGTNWRYNYATHVQGPELPTVTLTWHACKNKVHKLHQKYILVLFQILDVFFTGHRDLVQLCDI